MYVCDIFASTHCRVMVSRECGQSVCLACMACTNVSSHAHTCIHIYRCLYAHANMYALHTHISYVCSEKWMGDVTGRPINDNWWQTETGWPVCSNFLGMGK